MTTQNTTYHPNQISLRPAKKFPAKEREAIFNIQIDFLNKNRQNIEIHELVSASNNNNDTQYSVNKDKSRQGEMIYESPSGFKTAPRKYENSKDSLELSEYLKKFLGKGTIKSMDYKNR